MSLRLDFSDLNVMIAGEVGIDEYVSGTSTRRSPECDVPVVSDIEVTRYAGMTGNLANNIDSLGARSRLFTVMGGYGHSIGAFQDLLTGSSLAYVTDDSRRKTLKQRIICNDQQIARLDYESTQPLASDVETQFVSLLCDHVARYDAVLLQDYGKGLWTGRVLSYFLSHCESINKKVFVDPYRGRKPEDYRGAYLIKPNLKEANEMTSFECHKVLDMSRELNNRTGALIALTLGPSGMIFNHIHYSAIPVSSPVDVTGAGDTTMAALTLSLLKGNSFKDSARLANKAGSLAVQKPGPATVTIEGLLSSVINRGEK